MPHCPAARRRTSCAVVAFLVWGLLGLAVLADAADAAVPTYVVAGDDSAVTGGAWGFHEAYFSDLRSILTDPAVFGENGTVHAGFSIASPRDTPLGAHSLDGIDVYFLSGRDVDPAEYAILDAFVAGGGAIVVSSNAPDFYDTTAGMGFTMSPRVVYGDGPDGYDETHRAPSPSTIVAAQSTHPIATGPFGAVSSFENWHSVAGFTAVPADATVIARTTLTGPDDNGSPHNITLSNVATLAVVPAGARGSGSGPIVATSDVDTFSNAYTVDTTFPVTDALCTLYGTTNGTLARNTFAWLAQQLATTSTTTTSSTTSTTTSSTSTTTTSLAVTSTTAAPTSTTTLPPAPHGYLPLPTPTRILDTRAGIGGVAAPFGAGERRALTVTVAGVPADAELVALNITAVDPTATGYLTAAPAGGPLPDVSNLNFVAGTTVANAALVEVGLGGSIAIFNSAGSTHVLVDIVGYTGSGGSQLVTRTPVRIKDTRSGLGGTDTARGATTQSLSVTGAGGAPANATAVVLNVTAVDPTATAYVTVWPADLPPPTISNLNTRAGATVANLVIVRVPADGRINLFSAAGEVDLLVDVLGWFVPANGAGMTAVTPRRVVDTRPAQVALRPGEVRAVAPGAPGAKAVVVNVTAVDPTALAFLTVFPTGVARPDTSTLNFGAGRTTPNLVVVPVGADGTISIYNAAGTTHLLVDVVARFD